jgi:hypothetical protein
MELGRKHPQATQTPGHLDCLLCTRQCDCAPLFAEHTLDSCWFGLWFRAPEAMENKGLYAGHPTNFYFRRRRNRGIDLGPGSYDAAGNTLLDPSSGFPDPRSRKPRPGAPIVFSHRGLAIFETWDRGIRNLRG